MGVEIFIIFSQVLSVLPMSILLSLSTALQGNQQTFNRNCFPFLHQGKGRQTSILPLPLPRTIYIFSRRERVILFSKVASSIVTILTSIVNSPAAAYSLLWVPGQRKDLSLWYAPALFGDAPIKSDHWGISCNPIQIREEDVIVLAAPFL